MAEHLTPESGTAAVAASDTITTAVATTSTLLDHYHHHIHHDHEHNPSKGALVIHEALVDSRGQLFTAGVSPVGAGQDLAEAGEPAVFEMNGRKVAVVVFGRVSPGDHWYAAGDRAGMRSGDHIDQMVEAVAGRCDRRPVVVSIHRGVELDTAPRNDDVERARAMIEAGRRHLRSSSPSHAALRDHRRSRGLLVAGNLV